MSIANAIAIGAVSGLRSMSAPAIVSSAACNSLLGLKRTPLHWVCDKRTAFGAGALALGEFVADKLPGTPNRTDIGPLLARAASGAFCGAAVMMSKPNSLRKASKEQIVWGALAGAAAAVGAAYAGLHYRKTLTSHPNIAAVMEDLFAVGLGAAAMRDLR